ncbi:hypothetical protein PCH_Pc16g15250 [Penicillium rubens Wisconsin 54-1255]|uniref:Uncharacterized protein n=1 Tax=Penicillium rubens (strain ATCC 28089 / DSM 1075 / NRRL 1951 / Wisconsin 54-1255) TaxID=500485 RepID=B6HA68_PENRW|nr:hypothetical protein PCH_Pc16g15250 [Penicillium rubens Wisconsin 54-1255]
MTTSFWGLLGRLAINSKPQFPRSKPILAATKAPGNQNACGGAQYQLGHSLERQTCHLPQFFTLNKPVLASTATAMIRMRLVCSSTVHLAVVLRDRAKSDLVTPSDSILDITFHTLMDNVVDGMVIAALVSALFSISGFVLVIYPKWLQENCAARFYYGSHIPYYKIMYYGSVGQAAFGSLVIIMSLVRFAVCGLRGSEHLRIRTIAELYDDFRRMTVESIDIRACSSLDLTSRRYWPTLEQYSEWLDVNESPAGPGNARLGPRSSLAPRIFSAEARHSFWGLLLPLRGIKVMLLLAASPTPGTSGAVPGAMANPSGSGRMSQFCAEGPTSATGPRSNQCVPGASLYSVRNVESRSQG